MDRLFVELAESWDALNRAIQSLLVAQPYQLTEAAAQVEKARIAHVALFSSFSSDALNDHRSTLAEMGEIAARSAFRANKNGDRAGSDQNRGQFVSLVKDALTKIPPSQRGTEANLFLETYENGAYSSPAMQVCHRQE